MEWEFEHASSIPIRKLVECANTLIERERIPETHTYPITSISKVQKTIERWKQLGVLSSGEKPYYFVCGDGTAQFWKDMQRYRGSTDWRAWPLEIPIVFTEYAELDWGNAI